MGCTCTGCGLDALQARQRSTLRVVLAINAVMFGVILSAAVVGRSSALLADSLDNLGDAVTYALSLYAVSHDLRVKARVALIKGMLIFCAAALVAVQVVVKIIHPAVPIFEFMGVFSLLGLVANGVCLFLLTRHRHDDINMASVWECSRNDIVSNLSVLVAGFGVWATDSAWPDLVVASLLLAVLLRSSWRVLWAAWRQLRAA